MFKLSVLKSFFYLKKYKKIILQLGARLVELRFQWYQVQAKDFLRPSDTEWLDLSGIALILPLKWSLMGGDVPF